MFPITVNLIFERHILTWLLCSMSIFSEADQALDVSSHYKRGTQLVAAITRLWASFSLFDLKIRATS